MEFVQEFEPEFDVLEEAVQDELLARAKLLEQFGPSLGRPWADTLKGSRHANLKELRFDAAHGVCRVAFVFDPRRRGILLVAGDKSGSSERRFYRTLIEKADARGFALGAPKACGKRTRQTTTQEVRGEAMARTLNEKLAQLSRERRERIETHAGDLIAEEMSLRELRRALGRTQVRVAKDLGIGQEAVSRLESRADMLISTLDRYIKEAGGQLELVARFPHRKPVKLKGLGDIETATKGRTRARLRGSARASL